MPELISFAEIETEFIRRVHTMVWCSMATMDTRNRLRSRILHPIWEVAVGWASARPHSLKAKHLAHNPYVSLAYIADIAKPVYGLQSRMGGRPSDQAACLGPVQDDCSTRRI
jgi:hypothetical protein